MTSLRVKLLITLYLLVVSSIVSGDQRLLIEFKEQRHQLLQVIAIADRPASGATQAIQDSSIALLHWSGPRGSGLRQLADPRQLRPPAKRGHAGHEGPAWRTGGLYSVVIPDDVDLDTLVIELPASVISATQDTVRIAVYR